MRTAYNRYGPQTNPVNETHRQSLDGFIRIGDEKRSGMLDMFMNSQASGLSAATGMKISWRRGPDNDCAVWGTQLGWFEVRDGGPGVSGEGI
jgi:hypothetical protein